MPDRPSTPGEPMPDPASPPAPAPAPATESYGWIVARPLLVLVALIALAAWQFRPRTVEPRIVPPPAAPLVAKAVEPVVPPPLVAKPTPRTKKSPRPTPPAPTLNLAEVVKAEASLDEASRERARADARLAEAKLRLDMATRGRNRYDRHVRRHVGEERVLWQQQCHGKQPQSDKKERRTPHKQLRMNNWLKQT